MNDDIQGIPFSEAEFDKSGQALSTPTVPSGTTDLIVVSHGWNNDRAAAENLYQKLFGNFATVTAGDAAMAARKVAIVGVIWPSRQFDRFVTDAQAQTSGGAAAIADGGSTSASKAAMAAAIDRVAPMFDDVGAATHLATLRALVGRLDDDEDAQAGFVTALRALLGGGGDASVGAKSRDDGAAQFFGAPAEAIFAKASQPLDTAATTPTAPIDRNGAGRAASLGDAFSKAANAVANLLNLTTYFEMKKRAGTVGQLGVAPLLDTLAGQVGRIHLVGHSFGGRVVTAAAANSKTTKLASLSLLQAAFSHFGFAASPSGFFRSVLVDHRIAGPILVTHTKADTAVGMAYPIASRFSQDNASAVGDANDEYGSIGSNGAQHMTEAELFQPTGALTPVGGTYVFKTGRIHNLDATPFIRDPDGGDAHGFVFVPEVAWAISRAMVTPAGA